MQTNEKVPALPEVKPSELSVLNFLCSMSGDDLAEVAAPVLMLRALLTDPSMTRVLQLALHMLSKQDRERLEGLLAEARQLA